MTSLSMTEKQQDVFWLRFYQHKSINEIASHIGIGRRAVLARLRNARRRMKAAGDDFTQSSKRSARRDKPRMVSDSQVRGKGPSAWSMEDI
jgi:DNA-directed RNA polymerase specialized sigma subunit